MTLPLHYNIQWGWMSHGSICKLIPDNKSSERLFMYLTTYLYIVIRKMDDVAQLVVKPQIPFITARPQRYGVII